MIKKLLIGFSIFLFLLIILILLWYVIGKNENKQIPLITKVKRGDFYINITSPGEIQAKSCENIYGPIELKNFSIFQYKIIDIIPEGSTVKKGDYIASLDKTEITNKLKEIQEELDKYKSQLNKTKVDTSLELRNERDKLATLKLNMEESQVNLTQSKYEPPTIIRQAEIELEKSKRAYNQALKNYKTKYEQTLSRITEITNSLTEAQNKYNEVSKLVDLFIIKAPKSGILIYKTEKSGEKISSGSVVSIWSNIIATLPDLSELTSVTYINEMDISKVSLGLDAEVIVDAFPDKSFKATVYSIANIGDKLPNSNTKVYEVKILLSNINPELRPSMSTKNTVFINKINNVLYIPIEAVHSEGNLLYVYIQNLKGIFKQEVLTGLSNENDIIINKGLEENNKIFLSFPENSDKLELIKL